MDILDITKLFRIGTKSFETNFNIQVLRFCVLMKFKFRAGCCKNFFQKLHFDSLVQNGLNIPLTWVLLLQTYSYSSTVRATTRQLC